MKDLDFESYSVDKDRAETIRSTITRVREQNWVEKLKLLVAEFGKHESGESASLPGQASLLPEDGAQVYHAPMGTPAEGLTVMLNGSDLKIYYKNQVALELGFLPKNGEYAVFSLDEAQWEILLGLMHAMEPEFERARRTKGNRQSDFKKKFTGANA